MTKEQFEELFSEEVGANGFYLDKENDVFIFREPLSLYESETDETIEFDDVDDMFSFNYNGRLIGDIIADMDTLDVTRDGGVGALQEGEFKFSHADRRGQGGQQKDILPAYANVRIKSKTLEGAMKEFHDRFKDSDHEWAYEVDPQSYVHQYKEGGATSVAISGRNKNNMILHNHPGGGAFSDSDLISASLGNERGIVASGVNGDYIFQKNGGHFKAAEFVKAVKRAKMKGKNYDDAVNKWLGDKDRQKQFGYTYKFVKEKKSRAKKQ